MRRHPWPQRQLATLARVSALRIAGSIAVAALLLAAAQPAAAAGSGKSGVRATAFSLPSGPGSMRGLGGSFQPDLNTGSGSYQVSIHLPKGTAGVTPSLALGYDTGGSNGLVGSITVLSMVMLFWPAITWAYRRLR